MFSIDTQNKKAVSLEKSKENEIAAAFPGELIWQELSGKRANRICVQYHEYGLNDEEHWDEIIDFLADHVAALMKIFKPLLDVIIKG